MDNGLSVIEHFLPNSEHVKLSFVHSMVEANSFALTPVVLQVLQGIAFEGDMGRENPHAHLGRFLEICATVDTNGVDVDTIRLRLFSFSLRGRARDWLDTYPLGYFKTWEEMGNAFLEKYFPLGWRLQLRRKIDIFTQGENETLYQAWERYDELLRKAHGHGISDRELLKIFYDGLKVSEQLFLDMAARGSLMSLPTEDAQRLMKVMKDNSFQWNVDFIKPKGQAGLYEVDDFSMLDAKIDALTEKLKAVNVNAEPYWAFHEARYNKISQRFESVEAKLAELQREARYNHRQMLQYITASFNDYLGTPPPPQSSPSDYHGQ